MAIKLIRNVFKDLYDAKKIIGEIELLRKMSEISGNCFTTHVHDIILPEFDTDSTDAMDYLFIVMEFEEMDLCNVLNQFMDLEWSMEHMTTMMYNMLCSIHYFHSAGLIHRDIKPSNFLMNFDCIPKLCDFGLARSMPKNIPDYSLDIGSTNDTESDNNLLPFGSSAIATLKF